MSTKKGSSGTSMSPERTPSSRERALKTRRNEESSWRKKNGPVKSYVDPSIIKKT